MKLVLASLTLALAAAPLAAPTAALAADHCFRSNEIRNHTVVDRSTILISVNPHRVFRIGTSDSCFAAATSSDPLIMRNPPGSTYICKPIDMDLGVKTAGGIPTHCIVSSITELTPAEIAALPKKQKP